MTKIAFIFPGQGSQEVGMGKDIAEAYPIAQATFEEADAILGFGLSDVMFNDPDETLSNTDMTQPAMYVHSLAMLRVLQQERPELNPAAMAGHSLGEFSALTAAGALSFSDGLRLVQERGRLMADAGDTHPGGMAAILGLDVAVLEQIVADASEQTGQPVVIANDNCPGQVVISGDHAAVDAAVELAKAAKARRALPLPVSVATHSPLMQPAGMVFAELVDEASLSVPRIAVYGNVTARPLTTVDAIREELKAQITSRVRWTETIEAMIGDDIEEFVEIGSKNVLTGLLRRINRDKIGVTLNNLSNLNDYIRSGND